MNSLASPLMISLLLKYERILMLLGMLASKLFWLEIVRSFWTFLLSSSQRMMVRQWNLWRQLLVEEPFSKY